MVANNSTEVLSLSEEETVSSLACPICFEIPTVNEIYQCENGHNICINCYDKLVEVDGAKKCPQCRKEMFKTRYTYFVTNNVLPRLKIHCPFDGCSVKKLWAEMENHKKECKHGKQQQEIEDRIREERERNGQDNSSDDEAEAWEIHMQEINELFIREREEELRIQRMIEEAEAQQMEENLELYEEAQQAMADDMARQMEEEANTQRMIDAAEALGMEENYEEYLEAQQAMAEDMGRQLEEESRNSQNDDSDNDNEAEAWEIHMRQRIIEVQDMEEHFRQLEEDED